MASEAATAPGRAGADHPYAPRPYRVLGRTAETSDTVTLSLAPAGGGPGRPFRPGQFNMVYAFGVGEVALSISGDAGRAGPLLHTVRSVGNVTSALARTAPGAFVGVRGPYGNPWPSEAAGGGDVVVVAGGLGLAPLRPLLLELFAHRERFGRLEIIYGARTPKDLLYYPELQTWRGRGDSRVQVTVDAAGRDWYGDVGLVTLRIPDARFDPARTVAFVCGPEIMMRNAARDLADRGVPESAIWLSMERNMRCAIAQCGHCQFGPSFICREGPVLRYRDVRRLLAVREV